MHDMSIWITPINLEEINQRGRNTLAEHLGIEFTEIGHNYLTAVMSIHQKLLQPMGIMHGGASCALAETVGSVAANFCIDQKLKACVGLDININHLRQVRSGVITATAKPLHLGKTTQVWEIKIQNDEQKLVAISRLTISVIDQNRLK